MIRGVASLRPSLPSLAAISSSIFLATPGAVWVETTPAGTMICAPCCGSSACTGEVPGWQPTSAATTSVVTTRRTALMRARSLAFRTSVYAAGRRAR